MAAPVQELAVMSDEALRTVVQHPIRRRILKLAKTPHSATQMARELGTTRQRVNYHVRQMHQARLLKRAGTKQRRGLKERRFVTTARAYVIAPEVLGDAAPDPGAIEDTVSPNYLLALSQRMQSEVATAREAAASKGQRLSTLSIGVDLRFESAAQRAAFAKALETAIESTVAEFSSPYRAPDGAPGDGRPYRLIVGCHPVPKGAE